jgi:hypothetical protein
MKHRRLTSVCLLACAVLLGGSLFTTTSADARLGTSFTTIWNHIRPKADQRYVKKVDRSKIVRVASAASNTGSAVDGTSATYLTKSITAPTKGFLVIDANGTYNVSAPTPLIHCGISLDGSSSWPGNLSLATLVTLPGDWGQCSVSPTLKVARGVHTVSYQAHNDGSGTVDFSGGEMHVVFIPFNGSGNLPAKVAVPRTSGRDIARR